MAKLLVQTFVRAMQKLNSNLDIAVNELLLNNKQKPRLPEKFRSQLLFKSNFEDLIILFILVKSTKQMRIQNYEVTIRL